jgi:hypothetical protein
MFVRGDLICSRRFPQHRLKVTGVGRDGVRVRDEWGTTSVLVNVGEWERYEEPALFPQEDK